MRDRGQRAVIRNFAAFSSIAVVWLVAGDGIIRPDTRARDGAVNHNGMSIDERDDADLYAFIRTLPPDTLRALYADDPDALLEYCDRYEISHLLINVGRYGHDYRAAARVFPPFDAFIDDLLADVDREQLVIPRLTDPSTIVYHKAPWIVLDVQRVRRFSEDTRATAAAGSPRDG